MIEKDVKKELDSLLAEWNLTSLSDLFLLKYKELKKQSSILDEIDKLLNIKKIDIERQKSELQKVQLELEKEDFYNRKQVFQKQNHTFAKVMSVILILLLSVFIGFITPSIKKRIEYNPYEHQALEGIDIQNNFKIEENVQE